MDGERLRRIGCYTAVILLIVPFLNYCFTFQTSDSSFASFLLLSCYICGTEGINSNGGTPLHFTPTLLHINSNRFPTFGNLPPSPPFTIALSSLLSPPTSQALLSLLLPFLGSSSNDLASTNALPSRFVPLALKFSRYCRRYSRIRLLPILASLNSIATGQHLFNRSSDLHFSKTLRQHRSYKGELQSFKLSDPKRQQLQQKLRHSSELFAQSTGNNEDIFNAIVDSGSSYSATNKFTNANPTPFDDWKNHFGSKASLVGSS